MTFPVYLIGIRTSCLPLAIALAGWIVVPPAAAQPGMPPTPVVVSKVVTTSQSASQSFVGTLVPIRKSVVGSAVDGRVVAVHFDEGDAVGLAASNPAEELSLDKVSPEKSITEQGEPLVQLRTVSLDIEISAAAVELKLRQNAELELKQSLPTEIESATAAVNELKAKLEYSKSDYQRLVELERKNGGIPRREIEEAHSTWRAQQQSSQMAESALKQLRATRETRLAQARARVEAQQAELRRLNELKQKYTIRAPFPGFVTQKMTELGQWVARGDSVMEIVAIDPIELRINVPQSYLGRLQDSLEENRSAGTAYTAEVAIESVSGLVTGEVSRIVPQADLRSRSFPVVIRIDNPNSGSGHRLKPGMLATASLFVGQPKRILLVKKDALVLGSNSKTLFVAAANPAAEGLIVRPVPVQTGASLGDWIEVSGAITAGEKVVIEGNERLQPGQSVQISRVDKSTPPGA